MLKIRLAMKGRKHVPFFHIVIANSKSPRDGAFLEKIGYYNPKITTNEGCILNKERYQYWISRGAQPTESVLKLIDTLVVKN